MSSLFSHLMRVYRINLKTPIAKFHYIHTSTGLGILADEKVVLLKNSKNGSELYLVGTLHKSQRSADTVKKVINQVRPDSVAIELCMSRARRITQGYFNPSMDLKVAMEESSRLGAECFFIDQDIKVLDEEVNNLLASDESIRRSYDKACDEGDKMLKTRKRRYNTRAFWREYSNILIETCPEMYKLLIESRDKLMFTRLRELERKLIVAVVGLAHLDGIELLWKHAEGDDDVQPPGAMSEDADQQKR